MKVTAVTKATYPKDQSVTKYDPDKLIRIIDELILSAPNIPSSFRFTAYNKVKQYRLLDFLKNKTDLRSLRIKNLLVRALKITEE